MKTKIFLSLVAFALAILPARAATFTVTNNADAGPGTLRQAILDANANPGANTITFDPSLNGQKILLTSGQLAISNSVSILGPGPDQLAVDGGGSNRVFYVASNAVPNQVMLAGLAITNGYDNGTGSSIGGGGIYNDHAVLTVSNVTVSGNSATNGGGIYNDGSYSGSATLTVRNSTVSGNSAGINAGGIYNDGYFGDATLTVRNSTVSGNSASYGGGIYNSSYSGNASLTVQNSTLIGNLASDGGGIYNDDAWLTVRNSALSGNWANYTGGGIYNSGYSGNVPLTVQNSTLIGNSASDGGGIYNYGISGGAPLTVQNSTLSGNSASDGGGIFNDGSSGPATLTMVDTLLAKGGSGENYYSRSGTVTNSSFNLSDDNSTTNSAGIPFATTVTNLSQFLGPLADNGGPTLTVALLPGSPAIDAGDNALIATNPATGLPVATDQRGTGHPRIVNGTVDIGAFESGAVTPETPSLVVTITNDAVDPFDGQTSLREALAYAATLSGTNTITFSSSTANGAVNFYDGGAHVIKLDGTQLAVSGSVTILGPRPDHLAIDGNHSSRVFYVASNAVPNQVMLAGLAITNGYDSSSGGGGIYNDHAVLTVSNVTLSGNSVSYGYGGGIYNDGTYSGSATLTVLNSTLSGNSAGDGGGILNQANLSGSATLTILNSTVSGNSTSDSGGGIYNWASYYGSATLAVQNSTLSGNSAANLGGGILNVGHYGSATLTIQNSTLNGNSAGNGGGIINDGQNGSATLTVLNSTLSGNSVSYGYGGGIYNIGIHSTNATLTMVDTLLAKGTNGANFYNGAGTITNSSYNLSDDNSTAAFATTVTNLLLGPLADNGGPTLTMALLPGSPAFNAGTNYAGLPSFDQRGPGYPRLADGTVDIGAFELQTLVPSTPLLVSPAWSSTSNTFGFTFTNVAGASFSVLTSTNLMLPLNQWTVLNGVIEVSPGNYQFTDPTATNATQKFYRVRSP